MTRVWNDGSGFEPIGTDGELGGVDKDGAPNEPIVDDEPFTGTLDGDGYEIYGLCIDRERNQVGLFGATNTAHVSGVELRDVDITGLTDTGALIGKMFAGTVDGCSAIGGDVINDGAVLLERRDEIEFDAFVGGLIGEVDGGVEDGVDESDVALVIGCEADVFVEEGEEPAAEPNDAVGQAGGLIGQMRNGARLEDSVARGDVLGFTNDIGGLVGEVDASFDNGTAVVDCEAFGDVRASADSVGLIGEYGGLVGENDDNGIIKRCAAHGDVDASDAPNGSEEIGGLVGQHNAGGVIEDSVATGDVSGDEEVGGLVGENDDGDEVGGLIARSHATGTVTGHVKQIGGLVGTNDENATVEDSFATGDVIGVEEVGGLVGENDDDGEIVRSFAAGSVDGKEQVGGLVGENNDGATIDQSYSIADVCGDAEVGGLVGENESGSEITESYAAGPVDGAVDVGGAIGVNDGAVDEVYWDVTATGQTQSAGSPGDNGLDTERMQGDDLDEALVAAFDFDGTWDRVSGTDADVTRDGYPILQEIEREAQLESQAILGQ